MQRNFTISTPTQTVRADAAGRADVVFTVANATQVPVGGIAKLVPLGTMRAEWLVLAGPEVREFPAGALHQFSVAVNLPPDAAEGRHQFRLDVADMRKNSEDRVESPVVTVEAPARAAAGKPSRSWIPIAALVALILLAGVGYLLFRPMDEEKPVVVTETAPQKEEPKEELKDEPKQVTVPNMISMAVAKAEWELKAAGLTSSRKEVIDRAAATGTVRTHTPAPGEMVAPGTNVELEVVVSATDLGLVSVPDVVGVPLESAKRSIESAGLVAAVGGEGTYTGEWQRQEPATVSEQFPKGGDDVKRGTKVTLRYLGKP